MRAITQRHVTIGFAMNVKFERIFVNLFIAAGAGKVYHHPVIGLDVDPAYLHVAHRGSHKMLTGDSQRMLSSTKAGISDGSSFSCASKSGFGTNPHAGCGGIGCCVMAGRGGDRIISISLNIAEWLTIDLAIGEHTGRSFFGSFRRLSVSAVK